MTRFRTLAVFAIAVLLSAGAIAVQAQDAGRSRGSVRPRFFNPFQITASRFTVSPFGLITFEPTNSVPAGAAAAVATSSALEGSGGGGVSTGVDDRPQFRPPVRSNFRPAPRPPF
jgi:hypothetical protein